MIYKKDEAFNFETTEDNKMTNNDAEEDSGSHYRYEYNGIKLDPYRIADIYGITNHSQFTIAKKALCAGNRGHKNLIQDIKDIKNACDRWLEMIAEDAQ